MSYKDHESDYSETYTVTISRNGVNGQMLSEIWRDEFGRKHRTHDLPAEMIYDDDSGKLIELIFYENGEEHRENGPSRVAISPDTDVVYHETWRLKGALREDVPAVIERKIDTGEIVKKAHIHDGQVFTVRFNSEQPELRGPTPEPKC